MSNEKTLDGAARGLEQRLRMLAASGPITTYDFMATCLYETIGGYYACNSNPIGRAGDFYTSVSVGEQFGRLLAEHIACVERELELIRRYGHFDLIEQGANNGMLMADILRSLPVAAPEFDMEKLRVTFIEPRPVLRELQMCAIRGLIPQKSISFLHNERELSEWSGVFFCNELLDAFPVRRFLPSHCGWLEEALVHVGNSWHVTTLSGLAYSSQELCNLAFHGEDGIDPPIPFAQTVQSFKKEWLTKLEQGDRNLPVEIRPDATRWLQKVVSSSIAGEVLAFDYGAPQGPPRDTIRAYRQHMQIRPWYTSPGQCDVTADVDFLPLLGATAEIASTRSELESQSHFLTRIFSRMDHERLRADMSQLAWSKWCASFNTLTHPSLMGGRFFVLRTRIDPGTGC